MKPIKNKQKPGISTRQKQQLRLKMTLVVCSIIFAATVVPLIVMNLSNSIESSAMGTHPVDVVNVSDQVFSNDKSIEKPVLIGEKIGGEHVIQIREKKIVNAQ